MNPAKVKRCPREPLKFKQDIGERVRRIREKRMFTQTYLARALGVSRTMICNLEGGKQGLLLWHFRELCEILKCKPESILW